MRTIRCGATIFGNDHVRCNKIVNNLDLPRAKSLAGVIVVRYEQHEILLYSTLKWRI